MARSHAFFIYILKEKSKLKYKMENDYIFLMQIYVMCKYMK